MIVRISGEDQYELPDSDSERLNELENAVVAAVEGGDEDGFADAFTALLDYVRAHGTRDRRRRARELGPDPAARRPHLRGGRQRVHRRGPDPD